MKKLDIYKCSTGTTIEILGGEDECSIECCGKPVELLKENTVDAAKEKHVPVAEDGAEGVRVKVGSVAHPMSEEHHIEWIEVINGDYVNRKHLHPGDDPSAEFYVPNKPGLVIRAYCNLHGLWKA